MGASDFEMTVGGKTADEAFENAVKDAVYWHGHAGYSGTIAEKDGYKEFKIPAGMTSSEFLHLIAGAESETITVMYGGDDEAVRAAMSEAKEYWDKLVRFMGKDGAHEIKNLYDEKWGPAVCWADPEAVGVYFFCGYASS